MASGAALGAARSTGTARKTAARARARARARALSARALLLAAALAAGPARGGWVDPDTVEEDKKLKSFVDGRELELIMSDEFNVDGRSFRDGHDPIWTALDHSDDDMSSSGGGSLQFYNSTHATTHNGTLDLYTSAESTKWRGFNPYQRSYQTLEKPFKSAMLQTWNKFCFTGGVVELSARLPGRSHIQGLWPAFWMLGNLGRATYEKSTNLVWPWSYPQCDRRLQDAQEISGCAETDHFALHRRQGRGATEIDIIEAMPGRDLKNLPNTDTKRPYVSTSLQIAPGVSGLRPQNGAKPGGMQTWYEGLEYGRNSSMNVYFYGTLMQPTSKFEVAGRTKSQAYQTDAISAISGVTPSHFDALHKYRLEWQPGKEGYLKWYIDDDLMHSIDGKSLGLMGSEIPREPSYLIVNTAVSSTWGFPMPCPSGCDCSCFDCKREECLCAMPEGFCDSVERGDAHFLLDYVRVYQDRKDPLHSETCDPEGYPTRRFIDAHASRYIGPNDKLHWGKALRPVQRGGGSCHQDADCGNGACVAPSPLQALRRLSLSRVCACAPGRTGPRCRSFDAKDDVEEPVDVFDLSPTGFFLPGFLSLFALAAALAAGALVVIAARDAKRSRGDGRRAVDRGARD